MSSASIVITDNSSVDDSIDVAVENFADDVQSDAIETEHRKGTDSRRTSGQT